MIAFKWLSRGAIAPFTGFRWPVDGSWVSAPHSGPEGSGVHACRVEHLAWWVGEELWRVELDGPILEREMQIEAPRARLLDQVTAWDPAAFVQACVGRTEGFAAETPTTELADYVALIKTVDAPTAAFVASVAAVAARGTKQAFAEERAWQARWLSRALDLF
ncbi:MAG: hypothetical protein E6J63_15220 [Deltaproteobacteria bacterium]|nr:MAG: hypothetical protein E6J63_15220 [Deltaproteobacteria bacterium]